jgi:hypothetical protein
LLVKIVVDMVPTVAVGETLSYVWPDEHGNVSGKQYKYKYTVMIFISEHVVLRNEETDLKVPEEVIAFKLRWILHFFLFMLDNKHDYANALAEAEPSLTLKFLWNFSYYSATTRLQDLI